MSREQVDRESASANMAMRPSIVGVLTEEQKQARDRHNVNLALFGNYLIENQDREMQARSAKTAYKDPSFDCHQAMPAIVVHNHAIYDTQSTSLAGREVKKRFPKSLWLKYQRKLWLKCQLKPTKKKNQLYSSASCHVRKVRVKCA